MKIVALAGGVGGAKMVDGLSRASSALDLTIIVNTGDDFTHLGLRICPDIDTICYTLAGLANPDTGWGRLDESWHFISEVKTLGGEDWFQIGDKDLATHIERTRRLSEGQPLSRIVRDFCRRWKVKHTVLPMSDQSVATIVCTKEYGELSFQDYFVRKKCTPSIKTFRFEGINNAEPAPGVLDSIEQADAIVICPSNPWVSIDPILNVPNILSNLEKKPIIAISPIIGGKSVKGPAAKMYSELGLQPSALSVAKQYKEFIKAIVIDNQDLSLTENINLLGIMPFTTSILMKTIEDRRNLGQDVLNYIDRIIR
ncbi:MAG: 2-phospho-L-lactate transferase [Chloroflexota bacterium]